MNPSSATTLSPAAKVLLDRIVELTAKLCDGFPKIKALHDYLMDAKKMRLHKLLGMSWPTFLNTHHVTEDYWSRIRLAHEIGIILESAKLQLPIKLAHFEPLTKFRGIPEDLKNFWGLMMAEIGEEEIPTAKEIKDHAGRWDFDTHRPKDVTVATSTTATASVENIIQPLHDGSPALPAEETPKDEFANYTLHELAALFLETLDQHERNQSIAIGKRMAEIVIKEKLITQKPKPEQLMLGLGPLGDAKLSVPTVEMDFFAQKAGGYQPPLEFQHAV